MGKYVTESLGAEEQIRYGAKRSLWCYTLHFLVGTGLLLGTIALVPFGAVMGALLAVAALVLLWPLVARNSTELVVTDKRVIAKFGLVSRTAVEIRLEKIESVRVAQGLAGRLLNYGDVVITGTGATHDPIIGISSPMKFRAELNAAMQAGKPTSG
jgi:uncharacterized membrane protein YdbT with pleckstrin-like domain